MILASKLPKIITVGITIYNNMRLSFDEYGSLLALVAKSRSEDPHTQVGGVAFNKEKRIKATAYNGLKSGMQLPDWMHLDNNRIEKADLMIHCESNLCSGLLKGECDTVYLTISPCIKCCQNIAALDIKRVIYLKEYLKCSKYKQFLSFYGIDYRELSDKEKQNIKNYLLDHNNFLELALNKV
jgi:deoxycytidylate deaminase